MAVKRLVVGTRGDCETGTLSEFIIIEEDEVSSHSFAEVSSMVSSSAVPREIGE